MLTLLLFTPFVILILAIVILLVVKNIRFQQSTYKTISGSSFLEVLFDKGLYGEYLTVRLLEKVRGNTNILVNVYLPNGKGGTTEIDIVFLHETGIYVLESKNYSGWIFGKEEDKRWCQSFPNGHKEFFYNPIKQNAGHMKALQKLLYNVPDDAFRSVIVFSKRCTLKKVTVSSSDIFILKRPQLMKMVVGRPSIFSQEQLNGMYEALVSYSKVSDEVKQQHIANVQTVKK